MFVKMNMYANPNINQMPHIHAPIIGYEGLYEISTSGKIRNLRWPMSSPNAFVTMQKFKSRTAKTYYWRLMLSKDGKQKAYFLHRLMGFVFVPGYKPWLIINHKDGNGLNCAPNNLEWITQKENIHHALYVTKTHPGITVRYRGGRKKLNNVR